MAEIRILIIKHSKIKSLNTTPLVNTIWMDAYGCRGLVELLTNTMPLLVFLNVGSTKISSLDV